MVRYKWRDVAEVDAYAGLLFAFVAAIAVAGIAGWRAFGGYFEDFQELLDRAVVSEHGGGEGHEWHGGDGDRGGRSHGGATVYAPAQATGMKAD